jgi:hypothetical protein
MPWSYNTFWNLFILNGKLVTCHRSHSLSKDLQSGNTGQRAMCTHLLPLPSKCDISKGHSYVCISDTADFPPSHLQFETEPHFRQLQKDILGWQLGLSLRKPGHALLGYSQIWEHMYLDFWHWRRTEKKPVWSLTLCPSPSYPISFKSKQIISP